MVREGWHGRGMWCALSTAELLSLCAKKKLSLVAEADTGTAGWSFSTNAWPSSCAVVEVAELFFVGLSVFIVLVLLLVVPTDALSDFTHTPYSTPFT